MLKTTAIVEKDIDTVIDTKYIAQSLNGIVDNVGIIFACTKGDWRKNDTWKSKGRLYIQIAMPYEKVAAMEPTEVREWMLQLAKERLGLVKKPVIV